MTHQVNILARDNANPTIFHLIPLSKSHLHISPDADLVSVYGRMDTGCLYIRARTGNRDFELFMELHRRCSRELKENGKGYGWDVEVEEGGEDDGKKNIKPAACSEGGKRVKINVGLGKEYYAERAELVRVYDDEWQIGVGEHGSCFLGSVNLADLEI